MQAVDRPVDRLIVALDLSVRDDILRTVDELHGAAGVFKIGLQAFVANGPGLVREIVARGDRVFLDLKIHDIPNTAKHAVSEAVFLGASIVTVHASGGDAMLRACAESQRDALVLGVTILTSLDESDLPRIGFSGSVPSNAVRLAQLVQSAGLRGVVASPREIGALREACGRDLVILTPGIRPEGADVGDQRRTMTAGEAIRAGEDYIVVGRPITAARDRRAAAMKIVEEISAV